MDIISRWWRQPDHYRWLSSYLAAHDIQRPTRYMMAAIIALLAVVPMLMLASSSGPDGLVFAITALSVSAIGLGMSTLWLTRWPSSRQSTFFAVFAALCVSAVCLAQANPASGLLGCAAFAALAGYVAFFHSSRLLTLTLAIAVATAASCAFRINSDVDVALATSKVIVLSVSVLAIPFSAQMLIHVLGIDAVRSDLDPLTNLPNRRGFHRSLRALIKSSTAAVPARLAVIMVDLDGFKRINDTAGHAAGDRMLVAIGGVLGRTRRADSVVARIGGEEFVVAVVDAERNAVALADRLLTEIAQLGDITASIGVASSPFTGVPDAQLRTFAETLMETADRAMYRAKRAGGNQVYVVGRPIPTAKHAPTAKPEPKPAYPPPITPTASKMVATSGNAPWMTPARALAGAETTSTTAAASMDPTPAKTSAAPTAVPPELINPTPTKVTTAKKRL